MFPALSKSKLLRVLLALLVVQTISLAASGSLDNTDPKAASSKTAGAEDTSASVSTSNPSPPSSSRLSYTMLDVEDSVDPSGHSWRLLLEEMEPVVGKRLQDPDRVLLIFRDKKKGCSEPNPSCDTVSIHRNKDSYGVVRYKVFLHCNTKSEGASSDIDAYNTEDVIEMIAEFIGNHDDRHAYRAEKENR